MQWCHASTRRVWGEHQLFFVKYHQQREEIISRFTLLEAHSETGTDRHDKTEQNTEKGRSYVTAGTLSSRELEKLRTPAHKKDAHAMERNMEKGGSEGALKHTRDCRVEQ